MSGSENVRRHRVREARTLSVSIERDPGAVYAFVRDAARLPEWVAFCTAIKRVGDVWTMETDRGPQTLRFIDDNPHGVLDHVVSPAPGVEILVPMRVVPNGSGSEVLFTLVRAEGMTDEEYATDVGLVERDLSALKQFLEGA
jgi:hypothetical protein